MRPCECRDVVSSPVILASDQVLASMSRAMWEVPTPPLRGVALDIRRTGVRGRFLYAQPPTEVEAELVSLCETYFIADFPPQFGVAFDAVHQPVDQERTFYPGEQWVYLRCEADGGNLRVRINRRSGPVCPAGVVTRTSVRRCPPWEAKRDRAAAGLPRDVSSGIPGQCRRRRRGGDQRRTFVVPGQPISPTTVPSAADVRAASSTQAVATASVAATGGGAIPRTASATAG